MSARPSSLRSVFGSNIIASLICVFLFTALFNLLLLVTPLYITQIYSRVLLSKSAETLVVLTVAAIMAVALAALFDSVRLSILQRLSQRALAVLGEKVVRASLSSSVDLPNRELPLQDVDAIRRFMGGRDVINMMDVPFSSIFILILFVINPVVGLVASIMAGTMLLLALLTDVLASGSQRRIVDAVRQSSAEFGSFAGKGALLGSMGMNTAVVLRWMQSQLAFAESLRRSESHTSVIAGLSQVLRMATQIVVLATSAYFVMNDDLNPGMILACSILASRAVQPIDGMVAGQRAFRGARDAYYRIKRLLEQAPTGTKLQHYPKQGAVEATQVVYSAGRPQPLLRGVSLSIGAAEIIGIVGPSGAGKSLLGQMLVGALDPTAGAVRVDGIDLKSSSSDARASAFGYLPQGSDVLPGTIADNIARFGKVESDKVWQAILLVRLEGEIGKLHHRLETPMARAAAELSPGHYKRLLLARAFYNAPRLVVLDEPLSDLDIDGERMLAAAIRSLREQGSTIVLISPRGSLVALVDRMVVMRSGAIETIKDQDELAGPGRTALRPIGSGSNLRLLGP
jgi:PrtD family type I secretion system ABC transporter